MQENRGPFARGGANTAYARYFVGNSYLNMLSTEGVIIGNVTFEPGCRNNWHIHKAEKGGGQMLVGVAGRGWYQEEGKSAVEILPGTVIHIPANVKHWHGATEDSWFAHLVFEIPGEKPKTYGLNRLTMKNTINLNHDEPIYLHVTDDWFNVSQFMRPKQQYI